VEFFGSEEVHSYNTERRPASSQVPLSEKDSTAPEEFSIAFIQLEQRNALAERQRTSTSKVEKDSSRSQNARN
jgi:hypothetical protein